MGEWAQSGVSECDVYSYGFALEASADGSWPLRNAQSSTETNQT